MAENDSEHLSEEEATRLWKRAAEMQAEAALRAEVRAEDGTDGGGEDADSGPREGYALTHVRGAAVEAGISPEFVDAALADLRAERALPEPRRGITHALARRFLGEPPHHVSASRVIEAPAARVLEAMEEVLPKEPYNLSLKDRQGDPAHGGVLRFDILGASFAGGENWVGQASWADMREVFVTLRPIAGPRPACEVTVRSPVAWAFRLNFGIGGTITAAGGAAGFGLGAAAAGTVAGVGAGMGLGPLAAALAVLVVIGGGMTGGTLAMMGYRALYDFAIRKGVRALETMLSALAAQAQGGWGIASPTPGGEVQALPEPDS